jgi:hypothetical protein
MTRRKLGALALALVTPALLTLASCGGRSEPGAPAPLEIAIPRPDLPEPEPATATMLVKTKRSVPARRIRALQRVKGVSEVAGIAVGTLRVKGPNGTRRLRVGSVEPMRFRNIAPGPSRDADFVWSALLFGQAVPTFDAAEKLGLDSRVELTIDGVGGFEVGAFADNGVPNFVDVLVQGSGEQALAINEPTEYVIGAKAGTRVDVLKRALHKALPSTRITTLIDDAVVPSADPGVAAVAEAQPQGIVSGGAIGTMRFEIRKDGTIRPDPAWVAANIVNAEVPILGTVTCHRLLIPRLVGALAEIEEEGLAESIDPEAYGGCYVPRFIDRDTTKPLSNHAFGLALDLNTTTNQLGTEGNMDPRVVAIFQKWGFNWGGAWARPDPMHFEAAS